MADLKNVNLDNNSFDVGGSISFKTKRLYLTNDVVVPKKNLINGYADIVFKTGITNPKAIWVTGYTIGLMTTLDIIQMITSNVEIVIGVRNSTSVDVTVRKPSGEAAYNDCAWVDIVYVD